MKIVLYLLFILSPIVTLSQTSDNSTLCNTTPKASFFSYYFQKIKNKIPPLKPENRVRMEKIVIGSLLSLYYALHIRHHWVSPENNSLADAIDKGLIEGTARLTVAAIIFMISVICKSPTPPSFDNLLLPGGGYNETVFNDADMLGLKN